MTRHCELVSPEERSFRVKQALRQAISDRKVAQIRALCTPFEPWRQEILMEMLPIAMRLGNIEIIQLMLDLVDHSMEIHKVYRPPICMAAEEGSVEVLAYMLDRGEDPNQFFIGLNALCCAAVSNHCEHIRLLISRGATIDLATDNGLDAFVYACCLGRIDAGVCLVELGAIDHKDVDYLHRALASIDIRPDIDKQRLQQAIFDRRADIIALATPLGRADSGNPPARL